MIARNLIDLVGRTPLMELVAYSRLHGLTCPLVAKLEMFNPSGSVKARTALAMIEDAEARGLLRPGATLIEPTSGNTGIGLAMVATIKGYRLVLTMPETMSLERRNLLKALGAEIVLTPGAEGMAGSIAKAEALRDATPGSVILQQFDNPANAAVHERTTGEEVPVLFPACVVGLVPFLGQDRTHPFAFSYHDIQQGHGEHAFFILQGR